MGKRAWVKTWAQRAAVWLPAAAALTGCGLVREYWQQYTDDLSTGAREPTGYYEHTDTKEVRTELTVPEGMSVPRADPNMEIPELPPEAAGGPVGEQVDIRAPVAPLRSTMGLRSQWLNGEALVWFEAGGAHGISDEAAAWDLLNQTLREMQVPVGKVTEDAYELTTAGSDFNEFGAPYNVNDMGHYALRYHQIYRLRVGRSAAGELGVATQLIGSMTMLSGGHMMENLLTPIELERFAMGFSNNFISQLEERERQAKTNPDHLEVSLTRDRNAQVGILVAASHELVWELLRRMLPKYHWEITEYSSTSGRMKLTVDEESPEFYHRLGVDYFAVPDGDYVLRVGLQQEKSIITLYNKDDKPVPAGTVERIYSGFAQALAREYEEYRRDGGVEPQQRVRRAR